MRETSGVHKSMFDDPYFSRSRQGEGVTWVPWFNPGHPRRFPEVGPPIFSGGVIQEASGHEPFEIRCVVVELTSLASFYSRRRLRYGNVPFGSLCGMGPQAPPESKLPDQVCAKLDVQSNVEI